MDEEMQAALKREKEKFSKFQNIARTSLRFEVVAIGVLLAIIYISVPFVDQLLFSTISPVLEPSESQAIANKLTIRVKVLDETSHDELGSFLSHYSECSIVKALHIIPVKSVALVDSTLLRFEKAKRLNSESKTTDLETEAVLLLDSDVMLSCSDLEYAYNVWSSTSNAPVGFFPRLIVK
jgi:hypothetical protein